MTNRIAVPLLLLAAAISGCHSSKPRAPEAANAAASPQFVEISVDGDTGEWPTDAAAYSDEHYYYMRFTVQGEQYTLQASNRTVTLLIDADGSTSTGFVSGLEPMNTMGVDLEVQFSPQGQGPASGRGVKISAVDAAGNRTPLSKEDFDFLCAPTYASSWYEARISRTPKDKGPLPATGLLGPGSITCMATYSNESGMVEAFSDPYTMTTDSVCLGGSRLTNDLPPAKPAGGIRVMSWNIEKSSPVEKPEVFARVFKLLAPDVILLQEWEKGDEGEVKAWFETHVGGEWNVRKANGDMTNGGGVAVVSRYAMAPLLGDPVYGTYKDEEGKEQHRPVRSIMANVSTPLGAMLAESIHLKSGGSKDSVEDRRRLTEVRAINTAFLTASEATGAKLRVIGGDMNLVGSRPPLDVLRAGLDFDGSDLSPAMTKVLGDEAYYTWRDASTPFGPGRLDWIVYSDATTSAVNAFVLDTSRLGSDALSATGLKRDDCTASDHLASVVDFVAVGK